MLEGSDFVYIQLIKVQTVISILTIMRRINNMTNNHGIFNNTQDIAFAIKWHGEWNHSYFEPLNTM